MSINYQKEFKKLDKKIEEMVNYTITCKDHLKEVVIKIEEGMNKYKNVVGKSNVEKKVLKAKYDALKEILVFIGAQQQIFENE